MYLHFIYLLRVKNIRDDEQTGGLGGRKRGREGAT
jgi:hypothetical protein